MKYVARTRRPKAFDYDLDGDVEGPSQVFVHEVLDEPVETGLLDAHGTPLYRVTERAPMGFKLK